jgi:hypothetical protein
MSVEDIEREITESVSKYNTGFIFGSQNIRLGLYWRWGMQVEELEKARLCAKNTWLFSQLVAWFAICWDKVQAIFPGIYVNPVYSQIPGLEKLQKTTPELVSAESWLTPGGRLDFEEIRTILGDTGEFFHDKCLFQFLHGDELSENAFRLSIGIPIRLGYGKFACQPRESFVEDIRLFDKALESAGNVVNLLFRRDVSPIFDKSVASISSLRGTNGIGRYGI